MICDMNLSLLQILTKSRICVKASPNLISTACEELMTGLMDFSYPVSRSYISLCSADILE